MGEKRRIRRPEGRRDREISGSPRFRKKCWWKHNRNKMWVECPFREKVGQVRTPAADSWHRGATVKCWWKHTQKKWAYAANGWHRGVPFVMMGLCVPPSSSKQEGRICEGGTLCYGKDCWVMPYVGEKDTLITQLCVQRFNSDLTMAQSPTQQTGSLCWESRGLPSL